jgi:acyl-CoA dehydrogenase
LSGDGPSQPVGDLAGRTRRFIRDVVLPSEPAPAERLTAQERGRLQEAAKAHGVFAPHVGAEFGGLGLAITDWSPVFQEAGYSHIGPVALNCMAPDEGNMHLLELIATDDQKERYLRPLAEGHVRSCFAMTEPHPGAGSDPNALATLATPVAGGWRIDGVKRFISGALGASFAIVMARTEARDGSRAGATMFLVDMDNAGVRVGGQVRAIDRAIDGGHPYLHFEGCTVDDEAVLGTVGHGFRNAQVRLGPARLTHCMRWLGLARRSLDIALDRVERRQIFGSALKDLGLAQDLIARSVVDIETSDAIIAKTAALLASEPRAGSALSSVAKVHCADAVFAVIDRAMQLCGGDGMTDALPLASYLNEVRPFRVYDGSTETHKWAIARRATAERARLVESGTERRLDEVEERD